MFKAHNFDSGDDQEVLVFVDGIKVAVEAFRVQVETLRPEKSETSKIQVDDYCSEVMNIGEYAQFCTAVQMNKAIIHFDLSPAS
jgi:hypothetical protein